MHFDLTKSPKTNDEKKNSLLWIDLLLVNVKLLKAHCKGKCINKNLLANVGLTTKQLMKSKCHSFMWKKVLSSHSILLWPLFPQAMTTLEAIKAKAIIALVIGSSYHTEFFPETPSSLFPGGAIKKYINSASQLVYVILLRKLSWIFKKGKLIRIKRNNY